ncbi:MAG TPA: T9SS type A sorting domain-containing protein, partial [Chitinophagaceae bacterium]|nr:T9SS type A sorting domain-containing protein [Chitinophagaceae bacterium]
SLSQKDVACYGANTGSITASGSGGVEPYKYKLNDGVFDNNNIFNDLIAGTYTVYIQDANGCETFKTATLIEPGSPVDLTLDPTAVKCFGDKTGSIKATGSGGTGNYEFKLEGAEYSSVDLFDKLEAGTYTVYVKDENGCETSKQVTINQPDAALSLQLTPTDILCNGAKTGSIKAVASGGTPTYLYQLEDGGFGTGDEFTELPASTFTVYVQDANGCETSEKVEIKEPPVLELILTPTDVLCKGYESGMIKAQGSGGTGTLEYKLDEGSYSVKTEFENLVAGTYTVYVRDENGCVTSQQAEIKEPATSLTAEAKADKEKVCTDEKTNVTITASGGTPPYKYKYDNGAFGDTYIFSLGAGTHNFTVKDANECITTTSVTIQSQVCGNFCTYTQGYFGNDEGLTTNPDGGGNASYKDGTNCVSSRVNKTIQFALASPSLPTMAGNIPMGSLTPDNIINFLPSGGPSGVYTSFKLPNSTYKNTLLAQLLTLALNMGLNPELAKYVMPASGELWTQKASNCGAGATTSICTKYSYSNGKGMSVADIYAAASAALINSSVSNTVRSNWANTLDAINRGFDECARACEPVLDQSLLLTNLIATQRPTTAATVRDLKVKAYPNPFTDRIFINFTSPVAGKAVVEIFDMSGRRIAEINKGQINANVENRIEYLVPNSARSSIIYKVSVGSYSITGRMIAPTR